MLSSLVNVKQLTPPLLLRLPSCSTKGTNDPDNLTMKHKECKMVMSARPSFADIKAAAAAPYRWSARLLHQVACSRFLAKSFKLDIQVSYKTGKGMAKELSQEAFQAGCTKR